MPTSKGPTRQGSARASLERAEIAEGASRKKLRRTARTGLTHAALARLAFALFLALPAASVLRPTEIAAEPKGKPGKKPANGGKKKGPPPKDAKTASKGPSPAASGVEEPAREPDPGGAPPVQLRGPTRIDFDDRLIQGQTNKSGAVYLFDRKETGISSMVKRRKTFRQLTLDTIYDR